MAIRVVCAEGAAAYIWRAGDTIDRVAARFNTTAAEIRAINPGVVYTRLQPGELICVPTDNIACPGFSSYRVQEGDNIVEIAQQFGLRPGSLLAANPYIDPDQLSVGQVICIPVRDNVGGSTGGNTGGNPGGNTGGTVGRPDCPNCCPAGSVSQTVRAGDSLVRILARNDISYEYFRELNPNFNDARLIPGQRYCVPQVQPTGACETENARAYTWAVGDTLSAVAARYRLNPADILRANPALKPSQFVPGQVICLPVR